MSFQQKKKILDKLILDDYSDANFDSSTQQMVIYLNAGGVNLHNVVALHDYPDLKISAAAERSFLVSMPKKYRGLQYLKKNDLLIVDNIVEGKKVLGEVNCIISKGHVAKLYQNKQWPSQEFWLSLACSPTPAEGTCSTFAQSDWRSRFNSAFLLSPDAKKNTKSCCIQQDFISSSDYSSSEDDDETNEKCT